MVVSESVPLFEEVISGSVDSWIIESGLWFGIFGIASEVLISSGNFSVSPSWIFLKILDF